MKPRTKWAIEEGQQLCASLAEPLKELGVGIGLTGSVLHKGASPKDLDLILYPYNASLPVDWDKVREYLKSQGWKVFLTHEQIRKVWEEKKSTDTKHVEVWWSPDMRRVDVFLLK